MRFVRVKKFFARWFTKKQQPIENPKNGLWFSSPDVHCFGVIRNGFIEIDIEEAGTLKAISIHYKDDQLLLNKLTVWSKVIAGDVLRIDAQQLVGFLYATQLRLDVLKYNLQEIGIKLTDSIKDKVV